MKASIERWLAQRWYGGLEPGPALRALAGIYRVATLRRMRAEYPLPLPVPVIVVGNFTAGGTGKTPLTIAMAQYFQRRGRNPGIISRGHGRKSRLPVRVDAGTPVAECGDEPRLMFERTGLPVLVDADRLAAAHAAIAEGCDILIADDGLQNRGLPRDIEIEVVDAERRYGNGLLIPAGPLREAPRTCDFRVVNGPGAAMDGWSMQLLLSDALLIAGTSQSQGVTDAAPTRRALREFLPGPVHAVAAIGNPGRFFDALEAQGLAMVRHPFEDHHAFVAGDFAGMHGPILMTEKDAVKCRNLGLSDAWAVPVEARLAPGFFEALESKLAARHVRN
ncbi:MAG: tetraacyldisaccharide 4'-kinase [Gammaproteobacteria bacterium]|nr:tetraacyldisaccharide 4'-kinase [Gammaproteobacteria bacterium]